MNIYDVLKNENARISVRSRWLVLENKEFTVYEKKPYSKSTTVIYQGTNEHYACMALIVQEENKTHTDLSIASRKTEEYCDICASPIERPIVVRVPTDSNNKDAYGDYYEMYLCKQCQEKY